MFLSSVAETYNRIEKQSFRSLKAELIDTRHLHRELFLSVSSEKNQGAIGVYRGTLGSLVAECNIAENFADAFSIGSPYSDVGTDMEALGKIILRLDNSIPPSLYFKKVVFIFRSFLWIHPYFDGNGHIARLMLATLLFHHSEIFKVHSFSISPRPFSSSLYKCTALYREHPEILESYLLNWFFPKGGLQS